MITYVLFLVFNAYGILPGLSVSEFKSKLACEAALEEAKEVASLRGDKSKCIKVIEGHFKEK